MLYLKAVILGLLAAVFAALVYTVINLRMRGGHAQMACGAGALAAITIYHPLFWLVVLVPFGLVFYWITKL